MEQTAFAIKTDTFEGPLELLIELVEKRKLLINDISLAEVTDEYMRTVSAMQELSLPNTAHFVSLAATLLLIKSKSLLPVLELTEEEEEGIEDLENRLKYYQLFREAGLALKDNFNQKTLFTPEYVPPRDPLFLPDHYCTIPELAKAMRQALDNLPKNEPKPKAKLKPTISLEEMMNKLQRRIENQLRLKFSDLKTAETEHKNVIVSFLAILELFKQGNLIIKQESRFSDIELELKRAGTPRYY